MSGGSSSTNLNDQVQQLTSKVNHIPQSSGGKQFQLSPTAAKNYQDALQSHYETLMNHANDVQALVSSFGNVGNLASATAMKKYLTTATTQAHGLLKDFAGYVDDLNTHVKTATNAMIAEDNAGSSGAAPKSPLASYLQKQVNGE